MNCQWLIVDNKINQVNNINIPTFSMKCKTIPENGNFIMIIRKGSKEYSKFSDLLLANYKQI